MPNTKLALESSLKKLLLRKPLDKITINAASELTWTETDNSDRVPQQ